MAAMTLFPGSSEAAKGSTATWSFRLTTPSSIGVQGHVQGHELGGAGHRRLLVLADPEELPFGRIEPEERVADEGVQRGHGRRGNVRARGRCEREQERPGHRCTAEQ